MQGELAEAALGAIPERWPVEGLAGGVADVEVAVVEHGVGARVATAEDAVPAFHRHADAAAADPLAGLEADRLEAVGQVLVVEHAPHEQVHRALAHDRIAEGQVCDIAHAGRLERRERPAKLVLHPCQAAPDPQPGIPDRSLVGNAAECGMHALRQHQAQVQVVAALERTGPAHAPGGAQAAGIAGAMVVQLQAELQAVARPHLDHKVGGPRGGAGGNRGLRLHPRQVGQQQHRALVARPIQRLARLEHRQRARDAFALQRRALRQFDPDIAEDALADHDPHAPVHHLLHRHVSLDEGKSALVVMRGDLGGKLLEVGETDAGADAVGHHALQLGFRDAAGTHEFHALQDEARLRGDLRFRQGLRLLRTGRRRRDRILAGGFRGLRERHEREPQGSGEMLRAQRTTARMDVHRSDPLVHWPPTVSRQLPIRLNGAQ